jgi:cellulose synthase/poly-beta-1,6-N-acetylglucosamine synthase-like glycosyltransferase/peptidoglycan/xylan/chitin deacetylase (PgdA/CDA1 family)/spore germination protein YaaH
MSDAPNAPSSPQDPDSSGGPDHSGGHGSGGKPIFLDATGTRARRLRWAATGVAIVAAVVLACFVASLVILPRLTHLAVSSPAYSGHVKHGGRHAGNALLHRIALDDRRNQARPVAAAGTIAGAWFAPWEDGALDSFRHHAADLTHVYPTWLELSPDGKGVLTKDYDPARNPTTAPLVQAARANGVRIVPVVGNATEGLFDPHRIDRMLDGPNADAVLNQLVGFVDQHDFAGLQIDFEQLTPAQIQRVVPWLNRLHQRLASQNRELSIALEVSLSDADVRALAATVDYAAVMAYDEHGETSVPGPISSAGFVDRSLDRFTRLVPASKLMLGVGVYGYDWKVGTEAADSITNTAALTTAQGYRPDDAPADVIDFDPVALQPTFSYRDDAGRMHEVWFQDAASVANAMTMARGRGLRGASLWALGEEDPTSWKVFGRHAVPAPQADAAMRTVTLAQAIAFTGEGELLTVTHEPRAGKRSLERDPASGLITDESWSAWPSAWTIRRRGAPDHVLALTFDDGPDPEWTPKVLDILKSKGVKATFFMIGDEAVGHPELVRRVQAEGHEIGNHSFTHPNMAHVGDERVELELTAADRALESITGRQITLFRPPYNADSEPDSYGEIAPIAVASRLGYATAGESIDPNDWDLTRLNPGGGTHRLRPDEIVASVLAQADKGHAILLHDAGGDRSATVAALPAIIDGLRARGYTLTTIGGLVGQTPDQTMPALPKDEQSLIAADQAAFGFSHALGVVLFWGFSLAIGLGLLRIVTMVGLASGRRARPVPAVGGAAPRIDVMVAAFNEVTVINRTIESLLTSRDIDVRVLVIDDGSTDGTWEAVKAAYGTDPRVRLRRKANGGKASALNVALAEATAPIVVGVDADTQLSPDALSKLAAWFADPRVGAVAGNVKVGNRHNVVTRWQALEYITSQNVDRRALARLNAVTVVPGAIGGWRTGVLKAVGGYRSDTLAEDMDLTWRVREAGWVIANEPEALAFTEAPDSLGGLLKQRFRWSFGTLQCLWKHRRSLFRHGWFGGLALPSLWLFQIAGQVLAPLIDLQLLIALLIRLLSWWAATQHADISASPDTTLWLTLTVYAAFTVLELAASWIAYGFDREDRRDLWLLPTQRLVYRQIMYVVVWRALERALTGLGQAWGKLRRTGDVVLEAGR